MSKSTRFDNWLMEDALAALVLREPLVCVEGRDGVLFPPTFAEAEKEVYGYKFPGGYSIDRTRGGGNVCLVDSVGSQANRIEPLFLKEPYSALVPQIVVKAGEVECNLLQAGHRAGDALVRCSELQQELQNAFKAVLRGDAEPLAKIAPTSLVFGVWDSRDTQAKLPRLLASTIRAFDVDEMKRSAVFQPAVDFVSDGLVPPHDEEKKAKEAYSKRGFLHALASGTHGGVVARGGIRRDATFSLAALRMLTAGKSADKTLALRRYVLGLGLVAFTHPVGGYLRQGCNLVADLDAPREFLEVHVDGRRTPAKVTHADSLEFALAAAKAFGVGKDRTVEFDRNRAVVDLQADGKAASKAAKNAANKK